MRRSIRSRRGIVLLAVLTGVAWWSTPLVTRAVSNLSVSDSNGATTVGGGGGGSKVWHVPPTIDPTGTQEVTAHLNNWISKVPDGSVIMFPEKARYRVEGTVTVDGKRHLVLNGNHSLLFADTDGYHAKPNPNVWFNGRNWPLNRSHLLVYRSSDVIVANFRIRGPNTPGGPNSYRPPVEAQAGIEVATCVRCGVWSNYIMHVNGDGILFDWGSRDSTVVGNEIAFNGRQGITIVDTSRTLFAKNTLHDIGRSVFDLEPGPGGYDRDIVIAENIVVGPTGGIFIAAEGAGSTDNITVRDNRLKIPLIVQDKNSDGHSRRGPISIRNNRTEYGYDNYPIGMMIFTYVDGVEVIGNTAVAKPTEAVRVHDCTSVRELRNLWQQ
jgi:parallel beta-helix repeat protein